MLTLNTLVEQLRKVSECDSSITDSYFNFNAALEKHLGHHFEVTYDSGEANDPNNDAGLILIGVVTLRVFFAQTLLLEITAREAFYTTEEEMEVDTDMTTKRDLACKVRLRLLDRLKELFT